MKRHLKAFIVDLDGVITDTAEYHYQAWKRLAQEENILFTREDNEHLRGISRHESLLYLLGDQRLNEKKIEEMKERKNKYYLLSIKSMTQKDLLPGVKRLLDAIRERGLLLGLASSSKNASSVLKSLRIENIFHAIADGNSVKKTKPAPDLFLYTAKELGVSPKECVVVEDAASGIEGALQAGMITIGIGPDERVGQAHYTYEEIRHFDFHEFMKEYS